jgi:hypothetical protein
MANKVRRDWLEKVYKETELEETTPPEELQPVRHPWYKNPEILAGYQQRSPVMAVAGASASGGMNSLNMSAEKAAGRGGLFHDDAGWAHYKKQAMQSYVKEKQQLAGAVPRTAFIESSYPWRNTY